MLEGECLAETVLRQQNHAMATTTCQVNKINIHPMRFRGDFQLEGPAGLSRISRTFDGFSEPSSPVVADMCVLSLPLHGGHLHILPTECSKLLPLVTVGEKDFHILRDLRQKTPALCQAGCIAKS
jgi:hypothetical protein